MSDLWDEHPFEYGPACNGKQKNDAGMIRGRTERGTLMQGMREGVKGREREILG